MAPHERVYVAELKTHPGFRILMSSLGLAVRELEEAMVQATDPKIQLAALASWRSYRKVYHVLSTAPENFAMNLRDELNIEVDPLNPQNVKE